MEAHANFSRRSAWECFWTTVSDFHCFRYRVRSWKSNIISFPANERCRFLCVASYWALPWLGKRHGAGRTTQSLHGLCFVRHCWSLATFHQIWTLAPPPLMYYQKYVDESRNNHELFYEHLKFENVGKCAYWRLWNCHVFWFEMLRLWEFKILKFVILNC